MHTPEIAHDTDLPRLLAVWEDAVRATHDFLDESDIQVLKPLLRDHYLRPLELHVVRDAQGTASGFCGCREDRVEMLFVAPEAHGQGIGSTLLRHAVVRGARAVDVNEQNPRALGFYLGQGFEVVGRSPRDGGGRPFPILHLRLREGG
ncbi:putative acetyltransferase [Pseudomonas flavescens]|uniref:Putative acetyltransferase n=1 Tax=Phytopseudomonas flavescens TaxID=29435 RepID=A0A1G8JH75_9GAMM|nr:GNAT family N-acetyltransferase [Pseudomonas flavescens]SDI30526.1 putative acetyltransferase [Pseudomonas flavescens]